MRTILYSETQIGRDPKNPLCDVRSEDQAWIYESIMRAMGAFSTANQSKNELWTDVTRRLPKHFSKGRAGPNSLFSILAGLLANYVTNRDRYDGAYRFSRKQLEDLEFAFLLLSKISSDYEAVRFKHSLFETAGTKF